MKPTIMKKIGLTIVTVCFLTGLFAQPPAAQTRHLPAKRTIQPVKIDGLINEDAWKDAAEISDFTEFRPKVGAKENEESKTIAFTKKFCALCKESTVLIKLHFKRCQVQHLVITLHLAKIRN